MANYREIIEKNLPEGHTLTKNDITALHSAVQKAIGEETVPKDDYAAKAKKVMDLEQEIRNISGQASDGKTYMDLYGEEKTAREKLQGEFDTHKKQSEKDLADERAAHKATQDGYAAEKSAKELNGKQRAAAQKYFEGKNMRPEILSDFVLDRLDYSGMKLNDKGEIAEADKYFAGYDEQYSKYYATVTTQGAKTASPPKGNPSDPDPFLSGFDRK